jgi:hypothetical protein
MQPVGAPQSLARAPPSDIFFDFLHDEPGFDVKVVTIHLGDCLILWLGERGRQLQKGSFCLSSCLRQAKVSKEF